MELFISHHNDISQNFELNIREFDLKCCLPSYYFWQLLAFLHSASCFQETSMIPSSPIGGGHVRGRSY
jgi:hypothetical protein